MGRTFTSISCTPTNSLDLRYNRAKLPGQTAEDRQQLVIEQPLRGQLISEQGGYRQARQSQNM